MPSALYLDYAATTPVDPLVVDRMTQALTSEQTYGNAESKTHQYGWLAEQAVENARMDLAEAVGAEASDVIWTSGATESNNLAIHGVLAALRKAESLKTTGHKSNFHIITSMIEHKSVLKTSLAVGQCEDVDVTFLKPDSNGEIFADQVQSAITPQTCLVSLMQVNNELGTINPIAEIADLLMGSSILFHVDAAQSLTKISLNFKALGVDLMSLSAHKAYGPKGVGVLLANSGARNRLSPLLFGGDHEWGLRPGTVPTHQIIGMAWAAVLARQRFEQDYAHILRLQQQFCEGLDRLHQAVWHAGQAKNRIPHIISVGFKGLRSESLLKALTGLAVATGSACNTVKMQPSHVLKACGISAELADSTLRFSFGRLTQTEDVARVVEQLEQVIQRLAG